MADENSFTGVKVFTATGSEERSQLGEKVTAWISSRRLRVVDKAVLQSSDASHHCLSVWLFYVEEPADEDDETGATPVASTHQS